MNNYKEVLSSIRKRKKLEKIDDSYDKNSINVTLSYHEEYTKLANFLNYHYNLTNEQHYEIIYYLTTKLDYVSINKVNVTSDVEKIQKENNCSKTEALTYLCFYQINER